MPITCKQCKVLGGISQEQLPLGIFHLAHVDEVVDVQVIQMMKCIPRHPTLIYNVSLSCSSSNTCKCKRLLHYNPIHGSTFMKMATSKNSTNTRHR
jgi:hypothetical protein